MLSPNEKGIKTWGNGQSWRFRPKYHRAKSSRVLAQARNTILKSVIEDSNFPDFSWTTLRRLLKHLNFEYVQNSRISALIERLDSYVGVKGIWGKYPRYRIVVKFCRRDALRTSWLATVNIFVSLKNIDLLNYLN